MYLTEPALFDTQGAEFITAQKQETGVLHYG